MIFSSRWLCSVSYAVGISEGHPLPATPTPIGTTVGGESQVVARHKGRVVALLGSSALFHLESNRWLGAIDVEAITQYVNAFKDVALQLVRS